MKGSWFCYTYDTSGIRMIDGIPRIDCAPASCPDNKDFHRLHDMVPFQKWSVGVDSTWSVLLDCSEQSSKTDHVLSTPVMAMQLMQATINTVHLYADNCQYIYTSTGQI